MKLLKIFSLSVLVWGCVNSLHGAEGGAPLDEKVTSGIAKEQEDSSLYIARMLAYWKRVEDVNKSNRVPVDVTPYTQQVQIYKGLETLSTGFPHLLKDVSVIKKYVEQSTIFSHHKKTWEDLSPIVDPGTVLQYEQRMLVSKLQLEEFKRCNSLELPPAQRDRQDDSSLKDRIKNLGKERQLLKKFKAIDLLEEQKKDQILAAWVALKNIDDQAFALSFEQPPFGNIRKERIGAGEKLEIEFEKQNASWLVEVVKFEKKLLSKEPSV